ncbi:type VI secretion system-associated protein VasI [Enterobacter soli]|uniref:type VI secretion system-associated protein VasI n=1 Tax=Enterobacter soli TaxID=885040 RepID=UPI0034CEE9BF
MRLCARWLLPLLTGVSAAYAADLPDARTRLDAMQACRETPAPLERLDCYDQILTPVKARGFAGALVKARYDGEAWTRALAQEKQRADNSTGLRLTRTDGERPMVIVTAPAIGSLPPRPVLMFSCVDNITRMQMALNSPREEHDVAVVLSTEKRQLRTRWFVRENGALLESSRGLSGIDEIKQLFGAKTLTVDTGTGSDAGKFTFNIDGLAQTLAPLREACHWAGE